ncbi:MAG: NAD(P)-dependent oxidoreductase [Promethearchaeati archaeon SRVP18_Atabeyarchaeia-1]
MKILVTGACGNIGSALVPRLLEEGFEVRGLDLPTEANRNVAGNQGRAEFVWGDVSDANTVRKAVNSDVDAVVHLAFVLPPVSEEKPALAKKVNVAGARNVLAAMKASIRKPKLVFSSTISVFGITDKENPPIRPDHPVKGTDNYTRGKILCEEMIRKSGVRYAILRLAVTLSPEIGSASMGYLFSLPLAGRVEFLHVQDACTAIINSLKNKSSDNKTFIIAGGKENQMTFKDLIRKTFGALGLPDPDWSKFTKKPNYADWYDTTESQAVLRYQKRTVEDYVGELKKKLL